MDQMAKNTMRISRQVKTEIIYYEKSRKIKIVGNEDGKN